MEAKGVRILIFGDVHGDLEGLARVEDEIRAADVVVLHGDLTTNGGRDRAARVVESVRAQGGSRGWGGRVLAQPGNMDRAEVGRFLEEEGINLHARGHRLGGVGLFGVGGSNPTPFATPTEYSEEEIATALRSGHDEVRDAPVKILVSHAPPRDTALDRVGGARHVGSAAVREFLLREQPALCVCGHIHEARGEDLLGETRLFNTGLLGRGGYVVVTARGEDLECELRVAGG